jgi:hypothetical protein
MGYRFQPAESIPLSYNSYRPGFPTLAMSLSIMRSAQTVECGSLLRPGFDSHRARFCCSDRRASPLTREVVGSIPTAPTSKFNGLRIPSNGVYVPVAST